MEMNRKRLMELAGMEDPDYSDMDAPPREAGDSEMGRAAAMDEVDTVSIDIPLFIRLLEWAREDSQTDMQLHKVAENMVNLSHDGESLSMDDYDAAIAGTEAEDGGEEPAMGGEEEPTPGM